MLCDGRDGFARGSRLSRGCRSARRCRRRSGTGRWRRRFAANDVCVTPTSNGGRILDFLDVDDHANDAYIACIGPGPRLTCDWRIERAQDCAGTDRGAACAFPRGRGRAADAAARRRGDHAGTDEGFLNSFSYPGQGAA